MQPTFLRMAQGHHGVQTWHNKPSVSAYKSPYAPKYSVPTHYGGISLSRATRLGFSAAFWASVAGAGAFLFLSDIPRVRKDITTQIPLIGDLFVKSIPPSDNPF